MKYYILMIMICVVGLLSVFAQTNPNHVYVKPYIRKDGTYVQGHYRTKANETNVDNFSTIGNVNPYTGKPGWIPPDNSYYITSYRDHNVDLGLKALNDENYYKALEYSNVIQDKSYQNLIRFRAYHGLGDFESSLYYVKILKRQLTDPEQKKLLDEWIRSLESMISASKELKVVSERYHKAIDQKDYNKAIIEASAFKSPLCLSIKNAYIGHAYKLKKQYETAISYYRQSIAYSSDSDFILKVQSSIEFCERVLKHPKAYINIDSEVFIQVLMLYAEGYFYIVDSILNDFGYESYSEESTKKLYQRNADDPERIEVLAFQEEPVNDTTVLIVVSLKHTSFTYNQKLKTEFKYFSHKKENIQLLADFFGDKYTFKTFILFRGSNMEVSDVYVFGGYLLKNINGKLLKSDLEEYD